MNGQTKSFKEKQRLVDDYILSNDPYRKLVPLHLDLRQFAKYVKDKKLKPDEISSDIVAMFSK